MTIRPSLKATLVAGAALGALATAAVSVVTPAMAADLIEPVIIEAPVIEQVKPFGGWYIRGDVGYGFIEGREKVKVPFIVENGASSIPGGQPAVPLGGNTSNQLQLTGKGEAEYGEGILVGVGVGGHLGQYLRADITADYLFNSDFDVNAAGVECAPNTCASLLNGELEAITVMANAYVDFGTYAGITPYVGAGIGFAHVDYGDLNQTTCSQLATPTEPCTATTANATTNAFEGDSSLRLAWSLAAGASYDVSDQFAIDAGYRYVRVAEGDVDVNPIGDIRDHGFDMHQVRVGARVKLH